MKVRTILLILAALLIVQVKVVAGTSTTERAFMIKPEFQQNNVLQNKILLVHKKKKSHRRRYRGKVFIFDPRRHRWYAYRNGRLVASGVAAGGASYCRDIKRSCRTPTGTFRIIRKGGANCRSSRYPRPNGGARMDYCMFFSKYYAIHGSSNVPAANVSHGCIRVKPSAARWLHRNFLFHGTKVIVRPY